MDKKFIDLNRGGQRTDYCRCIKARYTAGYTNHKGDNSGVIESIKIKDGTAKGYAEVDTGGVIDMAFPDSKTRRGRVQEDGNVCGTLDTGSQHGKVESKYRIRRLTPKECFRLQGWNYFDGDDTYFKRAEMVNSDSQLYKQAGNGVSVNVIEAIGLSLAKEIKEETEK